MKCSGDGGDEGTIDEALVFLGSFSQLRIGDQLVENLILIVFFPKIFLQKVYLFFESFNYSTGIILYHTL